MSHKNRGGGGKRTDIAIAKLEKRIAKRLKRKHGKPPSSTECNSLPETCNTKTLKGNVYHSAAVATVALISMRRKLSKSSLQAWHGLQSYKCQHCNLWHLGRAKVFKREGEKYDGRTEGSAD